MKMDELVSTYIALRDDKAKLKAKYDGDKAQLDAMLDKIEAVFLKMFNETGTESIKTQFGTAYKQTRTSAGIADWDMFLSFVKDQDAWEMLERRCSKAAIEQYKAANNDLPPGLNWREEQTVSVRR
jgi:hypothetical protein